MFYIVINSIVHDSAPGILGAFNRFFFEGNIICVLFT